VLPLHVAVPTSHAVQPMPAEHACGHVCASTNLPPTQV